MNVIVLTGRLGVDPAAGVTPSGKTLTKFRLAVDDGFGDSKKTFWFNVVTWGKTAEFCGNYLGRGDLIELSGKLTERSWDGTDGKKQFMAEIVADRVKSLAPRKPVIPDPTTPITGADQFGEEVIPY